MFNNSEIILLGSSGNFTSGNHDALLSKFDESGELQWFGIIQGGKEDMVAKGILKDGVIYAAGYTEDFSKKFIVPSVSEVTWETLYGSLDIPEEKYSPEPKKITLESSDYEVHIKTVSGTLNSPKNGDAWFFRFGKEKTIAETTTSTTETTSSTSTTITTTQTTQSQTTTSYTTTTDTSSTPQSSSTTPTSTSSTTSEESKGICGPSALVLFTLVSLLWRKRKR
ncbi:CGP-CTERM sorting domain-containing protein [Thermococcus sp. 101 C5]|nr:CGP-CTERM sorting domain-containing protein [Thermococcus bergensis]MPW39845.1 CGP-CTERM sorting domain-containing protein [Thermococcus sp. 101 C5]